MPWDETAQKKYSRSGLDYESHMTDEEWALVEPHLPERKTRGRPRTTDLRDVVNAILYMASTGCQWRALPHCFPKASTVRYYFYGWRNTGVLTRLKEALVSQARTCSGRAAEPTAGAIDSQTVKTTESGGPRGYDAGKKIKGRKRHIAVDADGSPLAMQVHEASVQDRDGAVPLIAALLKAYPTVVKLWADGGYQGPKLRASLASLGWDDLLEIVGKPKDVKGFTVIYRRWVVERTFAWL